MAGDIYATAEDLVVRLRADGADGWADGIDQAIESGSTGTEILMALRYCVDDLLHSGDASTEALELAGTLKRDLNELLEG